MWFEVCKVFVNVGNIIRSTNEMLDNGELYDWEVEDCINFGVGTTLAHELRHLAQANPYLPEDVLNQQKDDELDAEDYAREVFDLHPAVLISENETLSQKLDAAADRASKQPIQTKGRGKDLSF